MSNPVLSAATRCRCTADDLLSLKSHIPRSLSLDLTRIISALNAAAERYETSCSPAPIQQPKVDAPSWGAGVSQ